MAKDYDRAERDRIRSALIAFMTEHHWGTPTMSERTHVPHRTIHRFIKGDWVNHGAVQLLETFLDRLPNRPTVLQAMGNSLHKFFNHAPDRIGGVYRISIGGVPVSELTLKFANADLTWYLAVERSTGGLLRLYEGSLVFTGRSMLAVLKDQLVRTARVHMLHLNTGGTKFYGLVYDDGPLERGAVPYQLLQTTLERIGNAE